MSKSKISKEEARILVGNCFGCGKIPHSNGCLKICSNTGGNCKKQIKGKNN